MRRRGPPAEQMAPYEVCSAGSPAIGGRAGRVPYGQGGLVNPLVRELGALVYEFAAPFVLDGSKYRRAFGGAPTPHWYADNPA